MTVIYCLDHPFGLLAVTGVDAARFLQGQISCDVTCIPPNGVRGVFCTPKGRVYASVYMRERSDGFLLRITRNSLAAAIATLNKYSVFFQVTLKDVSDEYTLVFGRHLGASAIQHKIGNTTVLEEGWFRQWAAPPKAEKQGDAWLNYQFIQLVYCEVSSDMVGKWLPHNLGFQNSPGALSYSKGCYTGQEIVARTHHLGKVKKTLQRVELPLGANGGELINKQQQVCGNIVLAAEWEARTYALAVATEDEPCYVQVDGRLQAVKRW